MRRPSGVGPDELEELFAAATRVDLAKPDPTVPAWVDTLHGDHDFGLVVVAGAALTLLAATDERRVHFDGDTFTAEQVPIGADHGAAELLKLRPRSFIGPEPEHSLQAER